MKPKAFILMPFAAEFTEIYNLFIAETLADAGYDVFRADDIVSQQNILQDIVSAISNSDLIVADLTGSNPNVYYELGLAHAFKRPVVLLTQSITDLPFDLRSYRVLAYNTHFAAIQKARKELFDLAIGAREGRIRFGSPVSDFVIPSGEGLAEDDTSKPGDDDGEDGFIDHMIQLEDCLTGITELAHGVAQRTEKIGEDARRTGEEIQEAQRHRSSGTTRRVQKAARKLAEAQAEYASFMSSSNDSFASVLARFENSLEFVIGVQSPTSEDERQSLKEFIEGLNAAEEGAWEGRSGMRELATTMDALPKLERHLSKATQTASAEVHRYTDLVDQTIAILARARAMGERILRLHELD